MSLIRGINDGVARNVTKMTPFEALVPTNQFGVNKIKHPSRDYPGYVMAEIELTPGKFVTQLVDARRIEKGKQT